MICRSTLLPVEEGLYRANAAKELFSPFSPVSQLPFTRRDFFTEGPKYVEGMSISGVQQKLSLKIDKDNRFIIVNRDGTHILKPSPESYPFAAENEQCAMALSRMMGIPTAPSAIIPFADGEYAYITRRYDRTEVGKKHQEDLAQGFDIPKKDKYSKSYEEALLLSRKMSGGKLSVVRDLFNRILFAYIIGNDDMHLKNISLLKEVKNHTEFYDSLTPNYDQLFATSFEKKSAIGYLALDLLKEEQDGEFSDAYKIHGYYTSFDFYLLGQRTGLNSNVVRSLIKTFVDRENHMILMIKRSYMPDEMKHRAVNTVTGRLKALQI